MCATEIHCVVRGPGGGSETGPNGIIVGQETPLGLVLARTAITKSYWRGKRRFLSIKFPGDAGMITTEHSVFGTVSKRRMGQKKGREINITVRSTPE